MKIVADENIPLLENYFGGASQLVLKSGRTITQADLVDADILLIRSVTKVSEQLLKNTSVKFVGSTTSGADHLDTDWLNANHIKWSVASGCNAMAVAEYVICVIAALQKMNFLMDKKIRAAVVGVGKIGQLVVEKFKLLGFDVVMCDPFRDDLPVTAFNELTDFDIISFHTPLTKLGAHPTYHLVQKEFLQKQKKNCVLLNVGRGEVFSSDSLKMYGQELILSLDVFENEPYIDFEVLNQALIATPHIAGYSLQSKYRGVEMIHKAAIEQRILSNHTTNPISYPTQKISGSKAKSWRDIVLSIFNPLDTTRITKETLIEDENKFDWLRKKFAERYEFEFVEVCDVQLPETDRLFLKKLGLNY